MKLSGFLKKYEREIFQKGKVGVLKEFGCREQHREQRDGLLTDEIYFLCYEHHGC